MTANQLLFQKSLLASLSVTTLDLGVEPIKADMLCR